MEQNVQLTPEQVKQIILELWKQGYTKSQIGQILKEKYGIKDVRDIFGKKLSKVMEELGIKEEIPEDLRFLFRKLYRMLKHLEKHKHDKYAKHKLMHVEGKVKALIKYYIRVGKLPPNFRFSYEIVKMYGST